MWIEIEISLKFNTFCYPWLVAWDQCLLTLYTLTSVCIFSILFFIHFLRCWQGEFVYQSNTSLVGDRFLYSHDPMCDSGVTL